MATSWAHLVAGRNRCHYFLPSASRSSSSPHDGWKAVRLYWPRFQPSNPPSDVVSGPEGSVYPPLFQRVYQARLATREVPVGSYAYIRPIRIFLTTAKVVEQD